ncbi:MAG: cytochrome c [Vicinamibacterales bacterium]
MRVLRLVWHGLALVGVAAIGGGAWFASQGVSSTATPGALETRVARTARHLLIPAVARHRANPVSESPLVLEVARAHWADHCASCHANDGSGQTAMGQRLYPKAPDMRLPATQALSDGELFHIIEHGVKLTGMPAWGTGTPGSEQESWELVRFIRHLPSLSEDELAEMDELNPRSRAEWQELEDERRFLSGTLDVPDVPPHGVRHRP